MRRAVLMCAVVFLFLAMVGCGDSNTTPLPRVSAIAYVHVNSTPTITSFSTRQSLASRDAIERHGAKMSLTSGSNYSINTMNVDGTNVKTVLTTNEYLYGVDLSPDGKKIVYIGYDSTTSTDQVFLLDVATQQSTKLTTAGDYKYDAMFTPDGASVIYRDYTGTDGNAELWKVSASGGTPTKIQTSPGICLHEPHVSQDGTQVVFDYHDATHSDVVGIVSMDGTNFKTVPNTTWVYTPALSRDKATVFFANWPDYYPQIYSIKPDGTGATPLVQTGASIDPYPINDKVLFVWDTTGNYTDLDIYSMNADGTNQKKLTTGGINYMHWSGD